MATQDDPHWGPTQMILTIVACLAGVGLGAWIFYVATKPRGGGMLNGAPVADLSDRIGTIRDRLRQANKATDAGTALSAASYAMAMLDEMEATHGPAAVAAACNPAKLRALAARVQSRYGQALQPA